MANGNGVGLTLGDGWEIDLNAIKAKEMNAFQNAFRKLGKNNMEEFWPWAMKIIKKWPFEPDPSKLESYDDLGMMDLMEVVQQVTICFHSALAKAQAIADSINVGSEGGTTGAPESA